MMSVCLVYDVPFRDLLGELENLADASVEGKVDIVLTNLTS